MADNSTFNQILGRGLAFPLQIRDGDLAMNDYEVHVDQSVRLLLSTQQGERVMRPDFGLAIDQLAFEPNSQVTAILIEDRVKLLLLKYEPRIEVLDVAVNRLADGTPSVEQGALVVVISYRTKATNSVNNLVYPFYVNGMA